MSEVRFARAVEGDAEELANLDARAARALDARFGRGPWSIETSVKTILREMDVPHHRGFLLVLRIDGRVGGMLRLATKKPWAIDPAYFTHCVKALYLTSMAVDPELQGQGIGRLCMEEALRIAREWPATVQAIRLDAWDSVAGAGGFYAKCGFREVGRVVYRKAPLIYYERMLER